MIRLDVFGLALVLLCFYRLWGGSLYEWDKAIYVQVTRELLRTKSWGTLTWDGYSFFRKPPLYSWLTGLTYKLIGIGGFAARICAASFGFGVAVLTSSSACASDPGQWVLGRHFFSWQSNGQVRWGNLLLLVGRVFQVLEGHHGGLLFSLHAMRRGV